MSVIRFPEPVVETYESMYRRGRCRCGQVMVTDRDNPKSLDCIVCARCTDQAWATSLMGQVVVSAEVDHEGNLTVELDNGGFVFASLLC